MISSQQVDALGELAFERKEKGEHFDGIVAPIDVIPQKTILLGWGISAAFKDSEEVVNVAVNVPDDHNWRREPQQGRLCREDWISGITQIQEEIDRNNVLELAGKCGTTSKDRADQGMHRRGIHLLNGLERRAVYFSGFRFVWHFLTGRGGWCDFLRARAWAGEVTRYGFKLDADGRWGNGAVEDLFGTKQKLVLGWFTGSSQKGKLGFLCRVP
jgi:hypothetical protein